MFDIGISLGFEGSTDQQIVAGLEAVKNSVKGVIVEDEKLSDAQKKLARSAVALEEQINRNIRSYMSSTSAILQATADELKYGDALREKLDLLRKLEAEDARIKKHEKDKAKATQDEKQAIRELTAEIKEKQRAEEERIAAKVKGENDAAKRLKKLADDRIALERQVAEVNAQISETMISDAQRVALEQIAWSRKSVRERIAALEELKLLQGTPGITQDYIAGKFGAGAMADGNLAGYKTQAAAAAATLAAEKLAMEEIAWAEKSWKERARITDSVTRHMGNAAISQEAIVKRYGAGAVEAARSHDSHVNAYRANLERLQNDNHGANRSFAEAMRGLIGNSRVRSEIIVLIHELMTGQFRRFSTSLIVLAEYGGLAGYVLSAMGAAVIGLGVAFVTTAILVARGSLEFDHLKSVLKMTGYYAGLTTEGFYAMARSISASYGTIGLAKEAMFALAESGRFTKAQIDNIAPAIVVMAQAGNTPVGELVKRFESLGKSPVQASIALNEQFHYLTVAVYEQIAALDQQGNRLGAALLATDAYAKASIERSEELLDNLGNVAYAWHAIERAASAAKNAIMNWGTPDTNVFGEAETALLAIETKLAKFVREGGSNESAYYKNVTKELIAARKARDEALTKFNADAEAARIRAEDKAWAQEALTSAERLRERQRFLNTPEQKREANAALVYNEQSNVLVDFLRSKGVERAAIREAGKFEVVTHFQTTKELLDQGKARYDRLTALARDANVNIARYEEQTALIIDKANKRNRDRVINNASFQETNIRVQAAENTFKDLERTAMAEISMLEKTGSAEQRIASDKLAQARAIAKNSNELNIVSLAAYEAYTNRMEELTDERLSKELLQVESLRNANRARFIAEQSTFAGQTTVTEHDRDRLFGDASASLQKYMAGINRLNELEQTLRNNATNAALTAKADTYRLMTQDIEQVHASLNKTYGDMLRQYDIMGLSNDQVKMRDVREKAKQETIVATALIETQARIASSVANSEENKELLVREAFLKRVLEMFKKIAKLEEDTAKKRGNPMQAGITSYLSSMEDGFTLTEKAVAKAFKGMEESLAKWVMTGKGGAKDLANSIISDMIRIAAQQYISAPFARMALAWMGGGFTNVADGTTNPAITDNLKGLAGGGSAASNTLFRVNEDGPELLEVGGKSYLMMGSESGNVVPNNQLGGGGGGQQISITINQTVGDVATVSMLQQSNAALVRQIRGGLARSQKYAGEFA